MCIMERFLMEHTNLQMCHWSDFPPEKFPSKLLIQLETVLEGALTTDGYRMYSKAGDHRGVMAHTANGGILTAHGR